MLKWDIIIYTDFKSDPPGLEARRLIPFTEFRKFSGRDKLNILEMKHMFSNPILEETGVH